MEADGVHDERRDEQPEADTHGCVAVVAQVAGLLDQRHVLDELERAPELLFDSVHQVRMPRWSTGRVVLVGDAAWCLNLYSGLGATSALRGGAELGTVLRDTPDDVRAALTGRERPRAVAAGFASRT